MRSVKILHVVNISFVIPYFLGDQIKYLQEKGFEVHIVCAPDAKLFQYQKKWGFNVFALNVSRKISIFSDLVCVYKLSKYIHKNQIDIVVGHTPKGGLIAVLSSWLCCVSKRVYFMHGLMFETQKGIIKWLFILIEKFTCFFSTDVVCVSNSVFQKVLKLGITNISKLFLPTPGSCNGVDTLYRFDKSKIDPILISDLKSRIGIDSNCIVIGFIGRLSKDKGINELILGWELFMKTQSNNNCVLILCGPDDERDGLDNESRSKILNNTSIIHLGLINNVELLYSIFHIFILPSFREGFPTVVLEASSMGLPVITTKSTGCVDSIIENSTGIFTKIDPINIATSIQFYVDNLSIAKVHGMNGRNFVSKNFEQSLIWEQLNVNIYS